MGYFVKPESVRLTLADGAFILVKKRLTHGEQEEMFARMQPFLTPGEPHKLATREIRTAKVVAYLIGWSLTDGDWPGDGQPVAMSPQLSEQERIDTIRNLDPDVFQEIHALIEAHESAVAEARLEEKKRAGANAPAATSPLPSAAGGRSPLSAP